jgi:hypothetical protein
VLEEFDEPTLAPSEELDGGWDETAHPREPAGSPNGGQFAGGVSNAVGKDLNGTPDYFGAERGAVGDPDTLRMFNLGHHQLVKTAPERFRGDRVHLGGTGNSTERGTLSIDGAPSVIFSDRLGERDAHEFSALDTWVTGVGASNYDYDHPLASVASVGDRMHALVENQIDSGAIQKAHPDEYLTTINSGNRTVWRLSRDIERTKPSGELVSRTVHRRIASAKSEFLD